MLVNNNGQGTGATHNTAVGFLDIDAEDAAIVNGTVTSNRFTNSNATPGFGITVSTEDPVAAGRAADGLLQHQRQQRDGCRQHDRSRGGGGR